MKNLCFTLCIVLIMSTSSVLSADKGMPQLDSEFWPAQILWLTLIFSSLYLIIWKIFLPRITYIVENRKSRIVNDLDEAQKLKENAEKKLGEYNRIIENSIEEAKKIISDGKKMLDQDIEKKKQKFIDEIENELQGVEKEIKNLKKSSISNINLIATETATEVIKQVIDTEVNKSNVIAIVEDITKKKSEKYI